MGINLTPENLKRYQALLSLFVHFGRTDLVQGLQAEGIEYTPEVGDLQAANQGDPEELVNKLVELGPTYIKLGQLLSTRPDLIPDRYIIALSRLQDAVAPFPFEEAREIVETELGVRISKAFLEFNPVPIAAASLSQVHYARLRSGGEVAVKVQRPGIRKTILEDLDAFGEIAGLLEKYTDIGKKYRVADILENFRRTLLDELDFRLEAANLSKLHGILEEYPEIIVPLPVDDYTTSRVLTMDYIRGVKILELSPVVKLEYDRRGLAEALSKAYLDQILVYGFLHADPHPGNVLLTENGKLALIDLGMVAYLSPTRRDQITKLLVAISEGKPEDAAHMLVEIGTLMEEHDENRFVMKATEIIQHNTGTSLEQIQFGFVVINLTRAAADNGIQPAPELAMIGKALLSLDQIADALDPEFNPEEAIRSHIDSIVRSRILQQFTPGTLLSTFMETYQFFQKLPGRLNQLFEKLADRDLEIKVHAFDEAKFMANMQKIANRIALGLVLAALIVGAALMTQVNTPFTVLGYPALATFMFLIAALLGFYLVIRIILEDLRHK